LKFKTEKIFRVPEGLEDVSKYPMLLAELARDRRWSAEDIKKLAGGNLIRVMKETERVCHLQNLTH